MISSSSFDRAVDSDGMDGDVKWCGWTEAAGLGEFPGVPGRVAGRDVIAVGVLNRNLKNRLSCVEVGVDEVGVPAEGGGDGSEDTCGISKDCERSTDDLGSLSRPLARRQPTSFD